MKLAFTLILAVYFIIGLTACSLSPLKRVDFDDKDMVSVAGPTASAGNYAIFNDCLLTEHNSVGPRTTINYKIKGYGDIFFAEYTTINDARFLASIVAISLLDKNEICHRKRFQVNSDPAAHKYNLTKEEIGRKIIDTVSEWNKSRKHEVKIEDVVSTLTPTFIEKAPENTEFCEGKKLTMIY
ncbi:hypothetical protein [Nevskia sp.]|uniref:hypothetical protein n=1 Tax=Nevskia sp. TaxID=1929292 RepID=UPI0025D3F16E|nr:hypothetical protein [Nevskia sp.]